MKHPWLLPVSTLLLGAAGGFFSAKNFSASGNPDPAANSQSQQLSRSPSRASRESQSSSAASRAKSRPQSLDDISKVSGNSARIQALVDLYAGMTAEQLEAEARKLDELPMRERIMASFVLFGRWAEVDPTAAIEFSSTMGFAGTFVRPTILQSWASIDPAAAANYYSQNPRQFAMIGMMGGRGPMGAQSGSSIIAGEWAKLDPQAAIQWAGSLNNEKAPAYQAILTELAKSDPAKAVTILPSMQGINLDQANQTIAHQYGASNFDAAKSWISTLPAEQRDRAMAEAISGLSAKNPDLAAQQLQLIQPGNARDQALAKIVKDMSYQNVSEAGNLLKTNASDGKISEPAVRELMPVWVGQNPAGALEFANSLGGDGKDTALQMYVWSNRTSPPQELVKIAEGISNQEDRNRTMGGAISRWMAEDEASAKAYVEQSSTLDEQTKKRLINGNGFWDGGQRRGGGNR